MPRLKPLFIFIDLLIQLSIMFIICIIINIIINVIIIIIITETLKLFFLCLKIKRKS